MIFKENKRVTRPGAVFLLPVEINYPPTDTEPHDLAGKANKFLRPEFKCEDLHIYKPVIYGMYQSILADAKIPNPENTQETWYFSVKFNRAQVKNDWIMPHCQILRRGSRLIYLYRMWQY